MQHTVQQQIMQILQGNKLPSGRPVYSHAENLDLQYGDESSNEVITLETHATEEEQEAELLRIALVNQQLMQITPPDNFRLPQKIWENELLIIWVSQCNDTFQIQLSDNSIHFIIHYSGQY